MLLHLGDTQHEKLNEEKRHVCYSQVIEIPGFWRNLAGNRVVRLVVSISMFMKSLKVGDDFIRKDATVLILSVASELAYHAHQ